MTRLFLALLLLAALPTQAAQPGNVRTWVIFPDTQKLVKNSSNAKYAFFASQVNWVVANRDTENIDLVLHLGDVIDNGNPFSTNPIVTATQWANFINQWKKLDEAGIPYAIVEGNHDNPGGLDLPAGWANGFFNFYGPAHFNDPNLPFDYDVVTCPHGEGDPCGPDQWNQLTTSHIWRFDFGYGPIRVVGLPWMPSTDMTQWAIDELRTDRRTAIVMLSHTHMVPRECTSFIRAGQHTLFFRSTPDLLPQMMMSAEGHIPADHKGVQVMSGYDVLSVQMDYQERSNAEEAARIGIIRFYLDENDRIAEVSATTRVLGAGDEFVGLLVRQEFRPNDRDHNGVPDWDEPWIPLITDWCHPHRFPEQP